jgi:hypothetical protein
VNLHKRLGIGELADGLKGPDGSSNILLLLLEHAPEPWDDILPETAPQETGILAHEP